MKNQIEQLKLLLKNHFFTGMLIFVPLGASLWLLAWLVGILWQIREVLPDSWQPAHFLNDNPTLVAVFNLTFTLGLLLLLAIGISVLGWSSRNYFGKTILDFISKGLISRIPVLRSVYSALDQLLRTIADGNSKQFNRVVYCEFPRKGVYSIAFVTGAAKSKQLPAGLVNVFIPLTPNPTSGFYFVVPEAELIDTNMSVEEAFKVILSLGLAQNG